MTINKLTRLLSVASVALATALFMAPASADDHKPVEMKQQKLKYKVVYHLDDADGQGLKALRNMNNHLNTAPDTVIVAVAHSKGVDMLMEGAKAKDGTAYAPLISGLAARGVKFEICEITLQRRKLSKDQFILEAGYTPSGVVRLTELQAGEGYAYIKP